MPAQTVLLIGGSGAQGVPIVEELSKHPENYSEVRVITRDPESANCKHLLTFPRVTLSVGAADDDNDLRNALKGIDLVFCNTNSFVLGIKNEIYWGIRIFHLSVQAGVKYFLWSSLDNFMYETGYSDAYRAGHYYGKAIVEQYLYSVPQEKDSTRWAIVTTGPYIEMFTDLWLPRKEADGTYVFPMPIADGAIPFVHLDDMGPYVHWMFAHQDESAGMNLKVSVDHVHLGDIPAAFSRATGKPAKHEHQTLDQWFENGPFTAIKDKKLGISVAGPNDNTLLTYEQNFRSWIRIYQQSGGNKGILRRDYALLDRIHPNRVRSLEQWFRKTGYTGDDRKYVLKNRRGDDVRLQGGKI